MIKRKLQRNRQKKKHNKTHTDLIITTKALQTAQAAVKGEPTIDCVGNFLFFSTPSGEGWLLDHRKNYALRLADNHKILAYGINETKHRFQVEWKERFRIDGEKFITSSKGGDTVFHDYPVDAITGLINMIKQKET